MCKNLYNTSIIAFLLCFFNMAMGQVGPTNLDDFPCTAYKDSSYNLSTYIVNNTRDTLIGDSIVMMMRVEGDSAQALGSSVALGTVPDGDSVLWSLPNHVFSTARFGGGQQNIIIIWPAVITDTNIVADSAGGNITFIDSVAGYEIPASKGVLGLPEVVGFETTYAIIVNTTNVGTASNKYPVNVYAHFDGMHTQVLARETDPYTFGIGTTIKDTVPTFNLSTLFGSIIRDSAFLSRDHYICFDASEDGLENNVCPNACYRVDVSPMPVELTHFGGVPDGDAIKLGWATATELNNSHFILDKMDENGDYVTLKNKIDGYGTTSDPQSYEIFDDSPHEGMNTYRLRQVDLNGDSRVIYVGMRVHYEVDKLRLINMYPNPFTDQLSFRIMFPESGELSVELFDLYGGLAYQNKRSVEPGIKNMDLDLSSLSDGMYVYRIKVRGKTLTGKVIKN